MPVSEILVTLAAASALGFASMPHCALMCGPLAAAACGGSRATVAPGGGGSRQAFVRKLGRYQLGRLFSYSLLGGLAGWVGEWSLGQLPSHWIATVSSTLVSWTFAVMLLFLAHRLWSRGEAADRRMVSLDRLENSARAHRSRATPWWSPALEAGWLRRIQGPGRIGLLSGLLPCGVLYTALLVSAGSGTAVKGAVTMFAFCVVSGVSLSIAGAASAAVQSVSAGLRGPLLPRAVSAFLLVGAFVLLVRPIQAAQAGGPGTERSQPHCH